MLDDIGLIIKFHRRKSGLTQMQLATLAGIGKAALYDMEHKTKSTRMDTLLKVLKVLNIDVKIESPLMKAYEDQKREESEDIRSK